MRSRDKKPEVRLKNPFLASCILRLSSGWPNTCRKFLAIFTCFALVANSMPFVRVYADDDKFDSGKYNHWGNSDIRWFLNTGARSDDKTTTFVDSTKQASNTNTRGYASHFTAAEYDLVTPSTVKTNILIIKDNSEAKQNCDPYKTTDKFFLPSANSSSKSILSWGADDISADNTYNTVTDKDGDKDKNAEEDKDRLIPISYWASTNFQTGQNYLYCWCRSPDYNGDDNALCSDRNSFVNPSSVNNYYPSIAAAFRLNLESVIFASAASAAEILQSNESGAAKKRSIAACGDLGKKVSNKIPEYGMYLKQDAGGSFQVSGMSYDNSSKKLSVKYTGGDIGKAIVVHAFSNDSLTTAVNHYVAAQVLTEQSATENTIAIKVNDWGHSFTPDSLTFKVWMEDPGSGVNLAKATTPQTFEYTSGFSEDKSGTASPNRRVFAMKKELKCSWGDLSELATISSTEYNNVLQGNAAKVEGKNIGVAGIGATNQKIYYGDYETTDDDENPVRKPMEFWIAGREKATKSADGKITYAIDDGTTPATVDPATESWDSVCLYQAHAVDQRAFKKKGNDVTPYYQNLLTVQWDSGDWPTEDFVCSVITDKTANKTVSGGTTYTSSNPYVATVTPDTGEVTINKPGTFEIVAKKDGQEAEYDETARTAAVKINHDWNSKFTSDNDGTHYQKCTKCDHTRFTHTANFKDPQSNNTHKCQETGFVDPDGNSVSCTQSHKGVYQANNQKHVCTEHGCKISHQPNYYEESKDGNGNTIHYCCGYEGNYYTHKGLQCNLSHTPQWEPNKNNSVHTCNYRGDNGQDECRNTEDNAGPTEIKTAHKGAGDWYPGEEDPTKHYCKCQLIGCNTPITADHNYKNEYGKDNWVDVGEEGHAKQCIDCQYATETEKHDVGTNGTAATCIAQATCGTCGAKFGHVDDTNHCYDTSNWKKDGDNHWHACTRDARHKTNVKEHDWQAATCIANRYCTTCLYEKPGSINVDAHDYSKSSWEHTSTVHYKKCAHAPGSQEHWGEKGNHNHDEWEYTSKGHWTKCSVCQYVHGDTSAPTPHTYKNCKNNGNGTHIGTCACGYSATEEHAWPAVWTTTKAATTTETGLRTRKCLAEGCGAIETQTIPKLTSGNGGNGNGGGSNSQCPPPTDSQKDPPPTPTPTPGNGTTSVEVSPNNTDANGIIWLKEESNGRYAWYGLDNSDGIFAEGSRFWVRWLSKANNPRLWEHYYKQIDEAHRSTVDSEKLWIFLIGVNRPDGTPYTDILSEFGTCAHLYVQLGSDWDKEDIESLFIATSTDEIVYASYVDTMNYPEGTGTFAKLLMNHFSPYAVYDKLTAEERAERESDKQNKNSSGSKTGDSCVVLLGALSALILSAVAIWIIVKKRKNKS